MIIKVAKRGRDAAGLMRYLYGPGKANEHTDQHMVAGYGALPQLYAGELNSRLATDVGTIIESSWRESFRERLAVAGARAGGISSHNRATGGGDVLADPEAAHVYHVIASNEPGEVFTDAQWQEVAQDVAAGMGFTSGPGDLNGAQWVAVRHGLSEKGNDHIHMVFSLVRQDGRPVRFPTDENGVSRDYYIAQGVRRAIEQKYDFVTPLHDRDRPANAGMSLPAYTQKEAATAREFGQQGFSAVPDRVVLQQAVRAAAVASRTEAEFFQNLGQAATFDVARRAPGGGVVTGYKVRLNDDARWFTASQLAPDLTLPKLRVGWAPNETAQSLEHAAALWRGEAPLESAVVPESVEAELTHARDYLAAWNEDLAHLDRMDPAAWKRETAKAAGIMSAIAASSPERGQQLGDAANHLASASLTGRTDLAPAPDASSTGVQVGLTLDRHGPPVATSVGVPSSPSRGELAARQVMLALRGADANSARGWIAVMEQLRRVSRAISDAHTARGELVAAQAARAGVEQRLAATIGALTGQENDAQRAAEGARFVAMSPEEKRRYLNHIANHGDTRAQAGRDDTAGARSRPQGPVRGRDHGPGLDR